METLFELTFQDQTLNPQVGTFTDASQTTGTFTQEDGEYYLTNGDTKGFYAYKPVAIQSGLVDDSKVIIEFDLKVVTASANTHTIIGTYAGVDGSGIPTGDKVTLQYNAGDIELVLGSGATETLIESADVVVDQWYHFRIDCALTTAIESTYEVKIDGTAVATVTGATTDYELGIISVLGTDLHACDECGIKNITFVTETNMYVGRTALNQVLQDVKGYVDNQVGACVPLAGSNQISGDLIPSTDNSIDIGSSTKNIKALYTKGITIDGAQFLPSDYIPKTGTNQISGDLIPSTDNSIDIGSSTKNIKALYTKGITINGTQFLPSDYIPKTGSNQISGDLIPSTDGTVNLGSSSKKFASLNGIAPDELGLPTSTYTDVSSYITNFDYTGNTFTAPVSGLLFFMGIKDNTANLECALMNETKGYSVNFTNFLFNNVRGLLPVEKGDSISVVMPESVNVTARIYHLKGKV